ncbi:hypothetical protein [Zhongshania sp.]|jgi:hypothetical protein|uniref:hypothetical protein n=1 Tax=Zhongshania sp. TaxID=1971902 RepID=UPI002A7F74DA|nr:hypothetical protein [Zhongshania sp.]
MIPDRMTPEHMARLMELVVALGDVVILVAANHMAVSEELMRSWVCSAEVFGLHAWPQKGATCGELETKTMAGLAQ